MSETTPEMIRRLVNNMGCLDEDSTLQTVFIFDALEAIKKASSADMKPITQHHRRWARNWLKSF